MNPGISIQELGPAALLAETAHAEIRILPDGTIYVHNLTRAVAEVLQALAPHDQTFANRVTAAIPKQTKPSATAADPDRIEHELPNRT